MSEDENSELIEGEMVLMQPQTHIERDPEAVPPFRRGRFAVRLWLT